MARSINTIQSQIKASITADPNLSGLNSPSQVAIYTLWSYIVAVGIFIQESLWDLYQTNLNTQIANIPAWTDKWVQTQVLKFQYDSIVSQVVQLDSNFVPAYVPIDATKQIITRISVSTKPNRIVAVKTAASLPPSALSAPQLTALQAYLDVIAPAGIKYICTSLAADQLMVGASIYYDGQYAASISASVIQAINDFMANIEFDGYVKLSALETAILNVQGVNDVVLNNVSLRADSVPYGSGVNMVLANLEIYNKYPMLAGYVIPEVTGGSTLTDTLTFIIG